MADMIATIGRPPVEVHFGENTGETIRQRQLAQDARDDAQSAASAALAAAGVGEYDNTAAGLSGTSEGETFWVDNGDGTGTIYRHDAGPLATEIGKFVKDPTASGAAALIGATGGNVEDRLSSADASIERIDDTSMFPTSLLWQPATEPTATTYFNTAAGGDGPFELIALWEAFRAEHPTRISREQIGTDESGTYPIYVYTIAPRLTSRRKIFLTCGIHGLELTGMLGVLRALRQFLAGTNATDQVKYLNNNVTICVVPVVNPWGLAQNPRKRPNSNGVDCNRNCDFRWSEYVESTDPDFGGKGSSAFSESEPAAVRDFVAANPDIYRMADIHGFTVNAGSFAGTIYTPVWYLGANRQSWKTLLKRYSNGALVEVGAGGISPSQDNYYGSQGFDCTTVEYNPLVGGAYSSADMTQNVRFHGNIILELACGDAPRNIAASQPFMRVFSLASFSPVPSSLSSGTIGPKFTFTPEYPGFLEVQGFVTVDSATSSATRFFVKPYVGQAGIEPAGFRPSNQSWHSFSSTDVPSGNKRATIPFNFAQPVVDNQVCEVALGVSADTPSDSIIRYAYWVVKYTPANANANSFMQFLRHTVTGDWTEQVPIQRPLNS